MFFAKKIDKICYIKRDYFHPVLTAAFVEEVDVGVNKYNNI